ncbi:hypothetical protein HOY82DRAFT_636936 [Tuber indicum]|nr:hypothetical protein HOY82DRAFT_636936 [Tuber indicum]
MLYIAGGFMKYTLGKKDHDGPNPVLRYLNLSKSFTTSLGSVSYIRTEKVPDTMPGVVDAAFFPTESGFDLTFGRWYPYNSTISGKRDAPIESKKWQYEIATQLWKNTEITLRNWFQPNSSRRLSSSMTAWVPSLKKGFLFGGTFVSVNATSLGVTPLEEHNGLITYDQTTNTWANETTTFRGISNGGLVHITTAADEVLIQFGGRAERFTRLIQFSEIRIYSTKKSKWYTQRLPSGASVPAPRFAFCTALKSASDGSSYQIYILGGLEGSTLVNAKEGPAATSVWVLSVPSFEWVQLPVMPKTTAVDPRVRISPKCQAIGEHYIFYYGGRNSFDDSTTPICDAQADAAFLLDVNTLKWTDEFIPNEGTYEIPPQVIGLIGGDKSGGSAKKEPANGWSDPDLKTVMTLKNAPTAPNVTDGPGSSSPSSKTNIGAIIGGTIAGIVAVALGLFGARILRRWRQGRKVKFPPNCTRPSSPIELMENNRVNGVELMEHNQVNAIELMEHNQVNGDGVYGVELPSGEVAREMDTGYGNEHEIIQP